MSEEKGMAAEQQRASYAIWNDLFHEKVPFDFIDKVMKTIIDCSQHQFQLLTKRPERAAIIFNKPNPSAPKNIWLGVTCENQEQANKRIPILLQIPAVKRFVSIEPCLEDIIFKLFIQKGAEIIKEWRNQELSELDISMRCQECVLTNRIRCEWTSKIDWVILGCESGGNRRPCKLEWVESIVKQCKSAGVPVFVKQLEIEGKVEHNITKFPKHLQIREIPNVRRF